MFKCSLDTVSRLGTAINLAVVEHKEGIREVQRKSTVLCLLAFCHPIMVYKAKAKNIPGLVPKQMDILECEKRLVDYTRLR